MKRFPALISLQYNTCINEKIHLQVTLITTTYVGVFMNRNDRQYDYHNISCCCLQGQHKIIRLLWAYLNFMYQIDDACVCILTPNKHWLVSLPLLEMFVIQDNKQPIYKEVYINYALLTINTINTIILLYITIILLYQHIYIIYSIFVLLLWSCKLIIQLSTHKKYQLLKVIMRL